MLVAGFRSDDYSLGKPKRQLVLFQDSWNGTIRTHSLQAVADLTDTSRLTTMTSHSLSIAKASLLASCLRPDFSKLNREDLAEFHSLLELTIFKCSSINIQVGTYAHA